MEDFFAPGNPTTTSWRYRLFLPSLFGFDKLHVHVLAHLIIWVRLSWGGALHFSFVSWLFFFTIDHSPGHVIGK